MSNKVRILFLEDNLDVVNFMTKKIQDLQKKLGDVTFSLTSITDSDKVAQINKSDQKYDVILLDQYSPNGSFHDLDFEKFGVETIISISSVLESNLAAKNWGVKRSVLKNYQELDSFADEVIFHIRAIIGL